MLGIHVSKDSNASMKESIINTCKKFNINTCQIFVAGPRTRIIRKIEPVKNINIIVHSSYITSALFWRLNDKKDIQLFKEELQASAAISSNFIVHLPKATTLKLPDLVKSVKKFLPLFEENKVNLCLEHIASGELNIADSWNSFCDSFFKTIKSKYVKLVLDTAHLWSSGLNPTTYKSTKKFLDNFKYIDKVNMLHLNGSYRNINSHIDKHARPMSKNDLIWGPIISEKAYQESGIRAFIEYAKKYNWVIILELDYDNMLEVKKILKIIKSHL